MVITRFFGKVIAGMETVDKIAATPTDNLDWPIDNIYIRKVRNNQINYCNPSANPLCDILVS